MFKFLLFFVFFILFSQSSADQCNTNNLKKDSLAKFFTCKTDQRLGYLKNYSSVEDWNETEMCNFCLEKIKLNKKTFKTNNDFNESLNPNKVQNNLTANSVQKTIQPVRGKWGINFSMKKKEFQNKCSNSNTPGFERYCSDFIDGVDVYFEKDGEKYVELIRKRFGSFTMSKYLEQAEKFSSRYKLLYKPSADEIEKFVTSYASSGVALWDLEFLFENVNRKDEPKFVSLKVITPITLFEGTIIVADYLKESNGRSLLKKIKKEQEFLDDI